MEIGGAVGKRLSVSGGVGALHGGDVTRGVAAGGASGGGTESRARLLVLPFSPPTESGNL